MPILSAYVSARLRLIQKKGAPRNESFFNGGHRTFLITVTEYQKQRLLQILQETIAGPEVLAALCHRKRI